MAEADRQRSLDYFFPSQETRQRGLDELGSTMRYDQAQGNAGQQLQYDQMQRIAADPQYFLGGSGLRPPSTNPGEFFAHVQRVIDAGQGHTLDPETLKTWQMMRAGKLLSIK